MTLEEAVELRKQDNNNTIRKPNCMLTEDENEQRDIHYFICHLASFLYNRKKGLKNLNPNSLLDKLFLKHYLKKNPITENLTGKGSEKDPFIIQTKYGKTKVRDAKEIFGGVYPKQIRRNYCFSNCLVCAEMFPKKGIKGKMVTGLAFCGKPFLHSVLYVEQRSGDKIIIDYNFDIIMDADLYFKLLSFEELCTVDFDRVAKDWEVLEKGRKYLSFEESSTYLCLAYDDVMNRVKEKLESNADPADLPPCLIEA